MQSEKRWNRLVVDLAEARNEISRHVGTRIRAKLPPGATAEAIASFEKQRGVRFPPSYRKFLKLHNGWVNFLGDYTLIGISGPHTERALRDIDREVRRFINCWHAAGRSTDPKDVAVYTSKRGKSLKTLESARIYLPAQLIFGIDSERGLLFFNDRRKQRDQEMEVIAASCNGEIDETFDSFHDMLSSYRSVLRQRVEMYRKLRETESEKEKRR